jgi:hypothetical protein
MYAIGLKLTARCSPGFTMTRVLLTLWPGSAKKPTFIDGRLVVRERHAVGLRGAVPDRRDEPFLVRCAGVEPALARDHPSHTHRGEASNPRLDRGKIAEENG